jgi:hypothetical protein
MESLFLLRTVIVTMNLHFHGPPLCRRPAAATFELPRFMGSFNVQGTRIATMNRLLPPMPFPVRGWGREHKGHLEFGYWSFPAGWGEGLMRTATLPQSPLGTSGVNFGFRICFEFRTSSFEFRICFELRVSNFRLFSPLAFLPPRTTLLYE